MKIKLFLNSFALSMPLISVISCKPQENKQLKLWGDDKFNTKINLNKLSYVSDLENVNFIAPFNHEIEKSNTMYQLTVYSFADGNNDGIGDFIGLANNLDYFVNLGIDTLYLSPIHPASSYHGYDVIDYCDVAPELGGMEAFDNFLIKAHQKGIRVILDMVINHTSYEHPWFQKALSGDAKYQKYYRFYEKGTQANDDKKYGIDDSWLRNLFFNVDKNIPATDKTYVATFWAGMPDLNLDNPDLYQEIMNIHQFWIKKGVDGFRYDAFYHIWDGENPNEPSDYNGQKTAKLFADIRDSITPIYIENNLGFSSPLLFGEWWEEPEKASKYFKHNNKDALSTVIDGARFKNSRTISLKSSDEIDLKNFLNNIDENYEVSSRYWIPFLDNHDVNRWILNRANDIEYKIDPNNPKISKDLINYQKYGLIALLSRGGLPTLYNGNELGMFGGPKSKGDNYVREAFPWNDSKKQVNFYERRSGKDSSIIKVGNSKGIESIEAQINNPYSIYNFTAKILKIRKEYDSIKKQDTKYIAPFADVINANYIVNNLNNITLRKNENGSYILFAYNPKRQFKFAIKDNFKIKKILLNENIEIEGNLIKGKQEGAFGIFEISEK